MHYFTLLPHSEQVAAIRRLSSAGMSDHGIAAAAGLAVEQIRRILAEAGEVRTT
jgi:hypothetical protein